MTYVFRNNTVERFLQGDYTFSAYDDISITEADGYLWWYQVPIKYNAEQLVTEIEGFAQKLRFVASQIGEKQLVVFTIEKWYVVNTQESDYAVDEAIEMFNSTARHLSNDKRNIKVVDIRDFTKHYALTD